MSQSGGTLLYYNLLVLGKTTKTLLDGVGIRIVMKFMLYQLPRNSKHVKWLPCKDVPIFLEEFDEHEFLFGI
jgi:hypothetical protein